MGLVFHLNKLGGDSHPFSIAPYTTFQYVLHAELAGHLLQLFLAVLVVGASATGRFPLIFVQIFPWNVVFCYLMRADFLLVIVPSAFHAAYNVGLERVAFLD